MGAAKIPNVLLALCSIVVLTGVSSGQTYQYQQCIDRFGVAVERANSSIQICHLAGQNMQCVMQAMHQLALLNDDFVDDLKSIGDAALQYRNVNCTIDYESIAADIRAGVTVEASQRSNINIGPVSGDTPGCGGVLNASVGAVASPGHPSNYPHYINCNWTISVQAGSVIRLHFHSFILEDGSCIYDFVEVYDNSTMYPPSSLGRYCGSTFPRFLTSTENNMVIHMKTDGSVAREGFFASYQALNASSVEDSRPSSTTTIGPVSWGTPGQRAALECWNYYHNAQWRITNSQAACRAIEDFLLCYMWTIDVQIHGFVSEERKRMFQGILDFELDKQRISCDFTIEDLADGLGYNRPEEPGDDDYGSGAIVTSPLSELLWGLATMAIVLGPRGMI